MVRKYLPWLVYGGISLAIMLPLYRPGYLFLLDMVWGPTIQWPETWSYATFFILPWLVVIKFLALFFATSVIQKGLLTLILACTGFSMYRLALRYVVVPFALAAGVMYQMNPYVYERFIGGQWLVLAGYAFFPVFVAALITALEERNKKCLLLAGLLFIFYPFISLHWSYIALGFSLVYVLVGFWVRRKEGVKAFHVLLTIAFLGLLYWLVSWITKGSPADFSHSDFLAFQTQGDPKWGIWWNVLGLYGFWLHDYFLPKDSLSLWWLIPGVWLAPGSLGLSSVWKRRDPLFLTCLILFLPILSLAVGVAHPVTRPFVLILAQSLPGFGGLRESAKVIGLLAFIYALLVPLGVQRLHEWLIKITDHQKITAWTLSFSLILLSITATHTFFWGAERQVLPADYPTSWYDMKKVVEAAGGETLILPWQGYLKLPMAQNHLVANPAKAFLTTPVIASNTAHNAFLISHNQSEWDRYILKLVTGQLTIDNSLSTLSQSNIKTIVLIKASDWERYMFLKESKKLSILYESPELMVYQVNHLR